MQVNFNGLYKIAGTFENSKGRGETVHDLSNRKLTRFLEETKDFRDKKGSIYFNLNSQDMYIPVKDDKEFEFEEKVDMFNIDCRKIGRKISKNSSSSTEIVNKLNDCKLYY